jgi:hypothetical protein
LFVVNLQSNSFFQDLWSFFIFSCRTYDYNLHKRIAYGWQEQGRPQGPMGALEAIGAGLDASFLSAEGPVFFL